eukprot:3038895-Rhodomonas_salina.1
MAWFVTCARARMMLFADVETDDVDHHHLYPRMGSRIARAVGSGCAGIGLGGRVWAVARGFSDPGELLPPQACLSLSRRNQTTGTRLNEPRAVQYWLSVLCWVEHHRYLHAARSSRVSQHRRAHCCKPRSRWQAARTRGFPSRIARIPRWREQGQGCALERTATAAAHTLRNQTLDSKTVHNLPTLCATDIFCAQCVAAQR